MKLLLYIKISIVIGFINTGFSQNATKRAFSDSEFYYEFEINQTNKKIKLRENEKYYWYKSNKIYTNFYDDSGKVLHGNYQKKKVKTLELLEKGSFYYGLKNGLWKEWFLNGNLNLTQNWKTGLLHGKYEKFNNKGVLLTKGYYRNGKKDGVWIDYLKKDTLTFAKGKIKEKEIKPKEKKSIKQFFNSIFRKKQKPNISAKGKKPVSKKKKSIKNKKTFWYRLFHKKNSKKTNH